MTLLLLLLISLLLYHHTYVIMYYQRHPYNYKIRNLKKIVLWSIDEVNTSGHMHGSLHACITLHMFVGVCACMPHVYACMHACSLL